ncbi:MAG: hypothetical protein WB586_03000 [Chthoniobacterales bacterium]
MVTIKDRLREKFWLAGRSYGPGRLAFADLKKQALVNEKAKTADRDPDFSRRIRGGVIGF